MGKPIPPRPVYSQTTDERQRDRAGSVQMMASTKTSLKAMAQILGITVPELKKQYAAELKNGPDYVYGVISLRLVQAAGKGDMRAMLAYLRQFGGWQEITRREITGKNGEPITFRNLDSSALASVIEALTAQGNAGRGAGRAAAQIDLAATDVDDLDAVSGATDEGATE
jgi:hypothetical protein